MTAARRRVFALDARHERTCATEGCAVMVICRVVLCWCCVGVCCQVSQTSRLDGGSAMLRRTAMHGGGLAAGLRRTQKRRTLPPHLPEASIPSPIANLSHPPASTNNQLS